MLKFSKSLKEGQTLFQLGNYMAMVDKSMRASNGELFEGFVRGQLVAKVAVVGSRGTQTLNSTVLHLSSSFNACCSGSSFFFFEF